MKKLILLILLLSVSYSMECDEGYTEIDGECYYQGDIDVLQDIIDVNESLSGEEPLEIGSQLWFDGRLDSLVIKFNQLTSIPESIGDLSNLETLFLDDNQLTTLPESIGSLSSLEHLSLSYNQLTSIPESIGDLSSLESLHVSRNQLTSIPESFCNLNLLYPPYMFGNNLCPPYPTCFYHPFTGEYSDWIGYQNTSECVQVGCMEETACNFDVNALYSSYCVYPDEYYDCDGCITDVDSNGICDDIGTVHLEIQNVNLSASTLEIKIESDNNISGVQYKISGVESEDNLGFIKYCNIQYPAIDSIIKTHNYTHYSGGNICFDRGGTDPPPLNEKGDLNEDGVMNILDLVLLYYCAISTICEQHGAIADMNGDGGWNTQDLLVLSNMLLLNDFTILSSNVDGNPMNITLGDCYCINDTDEDGICDDMEIIGCQDQTACNYNANATDLGDCIYTDGICDTCVEGVIVDNDADDDTVCDDMDNCPETVEETVDENGCSQGQLSISISLIPEDYSISRIYPNPFNPVTSITYGMPEYSKVEISIHNIQGRVIATLENTFQTAGHHTINWNASSYPSGVYLIRMDSGDFTQTQKVVLVK